MIDPEDPGGAGGAPSPGKSLRRQVSITDEQTLEVDTPALVRAARAALASIGSPPDAELSVALVTPEAIASLKGKHMGSAEPTDVLSFVMDGSAGPVIGDVVICPAVAAANARGLGHSLNDEMRQLVVHGILHLFGAEHDSPEAELRMRRDERRLLDGAHR